jgi:hypothetical protein
MDTSSSGAASGNLSYQFRPRIVGAEHIFRLAPDALEWESGSQRRRIPYGDIASLRLSYRPANFTLRRFLTEIWPREGGKLSIASVSAQGPFNFEDRSSIYSSFVVELGRRIGAAQPGFHFNAGMPRWRWWPAAVFAIATLAALLYVALQAFAMRDNNLAVVMLVFGALFVWQVGTMLLRNRPRRCEAFSIPPEILP